MQMPFKNTGHRWLFALLVCAGIAFGCHQTDSTQPSGSAADAKARIATYLAKRTGRKSFAPGMDLDLPTRVATLRSNITVLERRTASLQTALRAADEAPNRVPKNIETLRGELARAERDAEAARSQLRKAEPKLSNQEDDYIRSVRQQMSGVPSYKELYRLIGEQLATADRLLADTNISRRRIGLKVAREACGHVNSGAVDVWLASRICEAYLWPNLDLADSKPGSRDGALDLLETCRRVFFDTDETNNVMKNYQLLLANAPDARAADTFRVQVADWLEEKGNVKRAAEILDEIHDAEVLASAQERITRVRQRVAANP